ncbi:MAG: hypothetical protein ACRENX_04085, partial [Candidatus Dormibacteria bacterium]
MNLLRLYPRAWRDRYETEVLATLEESGLSPRARINILLGALDAQLHRRGYLMPSNRAFPVRRIVLLSLIPSVFVLAQFLVGLSVSFDSSHYNYTLLMGTLGIGATVGVCLWGGKLSRDKRRGAAGILSDGAATGISAFVVAYVVGNGLWVLDNAVGLTRWAIDAQGGHYEVSLNASKPGSTDGPRLRRCTGCGDRGRRVPEGIERDRPQGELVADEGR